MKRIVFTFIIVFFLIYFMNLFCLAEDISKPGDMWNGILEFDRICGHKISDIMKGLYIRGMAQGMDITLSLGLTDEDVEKIYDQALFIVNHIEEIINIMDDLYRDPANVNIATGWMCIIARSKLKGEDVEDMMRDARLLGLALYPSTFPSY
jgi:hypothetical protein